MGPRRSAHRDSVLIGFLQSLSSLLAGAYQCIFSFALKCDTKIKVQASKLMMNMCKRVSIFMVALHVLAGIVIFIYIILR